MHKKLFLIVAILALLVSPAFASVGAFNQGSTIGAATDINFGVGLKATSDGSTVTVKNASAAKALTYGTTVAVDASLSTFFTLTTSSVTSTTATITASGTTVGQEVFLKVLTSGTTSCTLTFSTGFKSTGTLASGTADAKTFTIHFISDGTNLLELGRTTAM
jgi:hypothetical protein